MDLRTRNLTVRSSTAPHAETDGKVDGLSGCPPCFPSAAEMRNSQRSRSPAAPRRRGHAMGQPSLLFPLTINVHASPPTSSSFLPSLLLPLLRMLCPPPPSPLRETERFQLSPWHFLSTHLSRGRGTRPASACPPRAPAPRSLGQTGTFPCRSPAGEETETVSPETKEII